MTPAPSSKALFRAIRGKPKRGAERAGRPTAAPSPYSTTLN